MHWYSGFEQICQTDVSLRDHTWYGLGGPARWLLTPRETGELAALLERCRQNGIDWQILGRGANVLVRDEGFEGAVIKLSGGAWEAIDFDEPRVTAGAGTDFPRLVRQTAERGLGGLETLAGIPGTVGGAVHMNAGGTGGCIADHLHEAELLHRDGSVGVRRAAELGLGYRTSDLRGGVLLSATFVLEPSDHHTIMERFRKTWNDKYAQQPPLSAKSAGCVFKNPPGHAAGALIDGLGLKGTRHGGAEISPRHANFILAHPGATAGDVVHLIALAKDRVQSETGIELELEIEIW